MRVLALVLALATSGLAIETVPDLDVAKYIGRWYQLYGNTFTARITRDGTCVAADYGLDQATGNITVINSERIGVPTGRLQTIEGFAYGTGPSNPGQLKVHLGDVPVDGDYWVVGLGPDTFGPDSLYQWALVSGPDAESLFVLVRDVREFEKTYARDVLEFVAELGFTGRDKEPQRVIQEGCLPFTPSSDSTTTANTRKKKLDWVDVLETLETLDWDKVGAGYASDEDVNAGSSWTDVLSQMQWDEEEGTWSLESWKPVEPVTELDINRYSGRWYQSYASFTAGTLLERQGACVTADYGVKADGSLSVVNTARTNSPDGELVEMTGHAYTKDASKPGQLTVHLDGLPVDGPYWVLAVGDEQGTGSYPWAIVSDPFRAFLFVLVRDTAQEDTDLVAKCRELGFTAPWNSPRKTVQEGCTYTEVSPAEDVAEDVAEEGGSAALLSALELRGGASGLGLGGPLHASCKMTIAFPKNSCSEVAEAIVSSAKDMMGFENCGGGNKCGYTVEDVADGNVKLVHETSVKHYKDDITFTLTDKGGSCEAKAFSTSQTWYAVLDNSVNYCNIHNLVDACMLQYIETDVSDSKCTQYSTADCERY
ncbi:conserved unknown protein [Ectocarpus siliculosus]|uniref:Lipocalin/cytosolic fatty-acid binding domain-containing protein n=1 Tax=Ectocarpus siliculosus TaxID=2880 RepID=D8LPQ3_ECTSI|nr:conserved unknown protein [Ectocarpus siliculosus]|eukprot:CBN77358.1 conserved unknown protein [Ectocarpus siliculosus]